MSEPNQITIDELALKMGGMGAIAKHFEVNKSVPYHWKEKGRTFELLASGEYLLTGQKKEFRIKL